MVIKKEKLLTLSFILVLMCVQMTDMLLRSNTLLHLTINVRNSHRQPQCTLRLVFENRVLFVFIFTFLCGGSSIKNASEQFVVCIFLF